MAFQCQTSFGGDLCFNGGKCIIINGTTIEKACGDCPAGWTSDNMFFHSPNCARPVELYLWLFAVFSFLSIVFLSHILYVRSTIKGRNARKLLGLQCVTIVLHWAISLSLYLEQGYYEGTIIVQGLSFLWTIYQLYMTMLVVQLQPLLLAMNASEAVKRRAYRIHSVAPLVNCSTFVILFAIILAYCRDPVPTRFNISICVFLFIFAVSSFVHLLLSRPTTIKLYELLNIAGEQNAKVARFLQKAEKSRREWNRMLIIVSASEVPIAIAFLCLGSFPYFWVYQSIHFVQIFPISYIIVQYFTQKGNDGVGTSTAAGMALSSDGAS